MSLSSSRCWQRKLQKCLRSSLHLSRVTTLQSGRPTRSGRMKAAEPDQPPAGSLGSFVFASILTGLSGCEIEEIVFAIG